MPKPPPTIEEILEAEQLRNQGEFATALALTQDLLSRAADDSTRMRLLFDVLYCSTRLGDESTTENAFKELEKLPTPELSRALANSIRANSEIDLYRPEKALALIDINLETGYFEREDFRIHKYDLLLFKGRALARMWRWEEAIEWLDKAHAMYPNEADILDEDTRGHVHWAEEGILLNKAFSLIGLKRFDEAFAMSMQVYEKADGWQNTQAMHQMADSRLWQGRASEALKLYLEIQKRFPDSSVSDEYIRDRIIQCTDYIVKSSPVRKSS